MKDGDMVNLLVIFELGINRSALQTKEAPLSERLLH